MNVVRTIASAIGLSLVMATSGRGQDRDNHCRGEEKGFSGVTVLFDQDILWSPSPALDQDYTMGLEFLGRGCWAASRLLGFPAALRFFERVTLVSKWRAPLSASDPSYANERDTVRKYLPVYAHGMIKPRDVAVTSHEFGFGNVAFTPLKANLGDTEPLLDDRPYANLFYLKSRSASAKGRSALVTDLTVGVLGASVGEWTQTEIHEHVSDDVRPGGWQHQISDGGELTFKYRVSPRWLLLERIADSTKRPWTLDMVSSAEASVGYYTNVASGFKIRAGLVRTPWWTFERNAIADVRRLPTDRSFIRAERRDYVQEAFVFASAGATAWVYNALLQGQFRHSEVTLSPSHGPAEMYRLTGDAQAGVTLNFRYLPSITYLVQWLTPTFAGPKSRTHSWGSFYLTFEG